VDRSFHLAKQLVKDLGRVLPDRIRLLSRLIARKPPTYTSEWASTIEQAFKLYTRTSTINLFQISNQLLFELDWPFPAYIDLKAELEDISKQYDPKRPSWIKRMRRAWKGPSLQLVALAGSSAHSQDSNSTVIDDGMTYLFWRHHKEVFSRFSTCGVLQPQSHLIDEIQQAYRRSMWASCIMMAVSLVDCVMRSYFKTEELTVSIQVLRKAFYSEAKLEPKDLMPGSIAPRECFFPNGRNTPIKSLNEDLRLPGIYLSSFFEFGNRYYEWYTSASPSCGTALNRHAIMHCASNYWTEANAVRILTFLDLTIRLQHPLEILIHGEKALDQPTKRSIQ
jgi:hypothetical protein